MNLEDLKGGLNPQALDLSSTHTTALISINSNFIQTSLLIVALSTTSLVAGERTVVYFVFNVNS